jgi:hypothetical protein
MIRLRPETEGEFSGMMSKENFEFLKAQSAGKDINSGTLLALLEAYERVSRSSFPDIALEASLLSLLNN